MTYNRNIRRRCALYALLLVTARIADAQSSAPSPTPRFPSSLHAVIDDARTAWDVPGIAVAVVNRNGIIAAEGFGVREIEKPELVDEHTMFDIASLTKSFTSATAGILVDRGSIRFDEPVRTYLPSLHFPTPQLDRDVTLRDLLSHRVGINPTSNWLFRFLDEDDAPASLRRVPYLRTQAPFRTTLVYSNLGYTVVGEALAAAAKSTWADLVHDNLLVPLGMNESYINGHHASPANVARPHAVLEGKQQAIRSGSSVQGGPAAGVRSTAYDMATWLRFHLGNGEFDGRRIISQASLEQTHSPQVIIPTTAAMRAARKVRFFAAYGMGWQVMDYRGHPMLWHTGSADGMSSFMAILPDDDLGIVVMINSWIAQSLHLALANRILDEYLRVDEREYSTAGLRPPPGFRDQLMASLPAVRPGAPAHALDAYLGDYQHALYGPVHIRQDKGDITLQLAGGEVADLTPLGADSMSVRWRDPVFRGSFSTTVHFSNPRAGVMTALRMVLARDSIEARRQ